MNNLQEKSAFERLELSFGLFSSNEKVWILTDEHGCVMLTTDDEDGVPVWPSDDLAKLWATEDWADCEPMAISLSDFVQKWIPGMEKDGLMLMVCPIPAEEGEVIPPDAFIEYINRA